MPASLANSSARERVMSDIPSFDHAYGAFPDERSVTIGGEFDSWMALALLMTMSASLK